MALYRTARRPLQMMLFSRLGNPEQNYSSWARKDASQSAFGMFVRLFSAHAPAAAEQMSLIKQLRERTSAPIKDVKASLVDCNWDIEAAQKDLRKRGKVLASKKSGRAATEGLLALAQNEGKAALIELNCETDFVARNDIFQCLALSLAKQALLTENTAQQASGIHPVGPECLEDLMINLEHPKISGETTVQNAITEVAAMMGENVKLRRGFVMSTSLPGVLSTYLHTSPQPGLGRIAGLLSLEIEDGNSQLDVLHHVGSELAMHVVAAKPLFLTKELVSSDALESEREILKSQAESTGKSQMAIEKMVEGRLRKYYEEVVLMEQKFIINDAVNVKTVLNNLSKEVGSPVKIGSFFRMEVGEGIQRLEATSADEPVAQAA
ncbi:elongation factor Ts, mitochondrial [Ricinus communis]|uniref:Elongation factor Ts, mitochondrial n=1 Tax=Ricinus communis TaxID=3988 RepID=EFTS_RICCO|nr:elongation factor Ts, mitochondrial [Ricinus communis]B9SEZ6.1 RecName: Full=Elongation factor Ts, mitochondrial; Short=EF-Ts; Short=EF-TsMt; Flags: Precursor [Ricinus communis]EEF37773.1 elongation factor ts, putative [Ricinus communis]|eukprot:XP_002524565.1 elongation factor Ts, mitochondrial [Ricinus communis]